MLSALRSRACQPQVASCLSRLLVTELAQLDGKISAAEAPGATSYCDDFIADEVKPDEMGTLAFLEMALSRIPYSRAEFLQSVGLGKDRG